jgi:hypothetical protein
VKHLLNPKGYALTTCNLTAALRGELTSELDEVTCPSCRAALINKGVCPECGEEKLAWAAAMVKLNPIVDGRLTMRDVEVQFYIGCGHCSETLISGIPVEMVLAALNEHRWRP